MSFPKEFEKDQTKLMVDW